MDIELVAPNQLCQVWLEIAQNSLWWAGGATFPPMTDSLRGGESVLSPGGDMDWNGQELWWSRVSCVQDVHLDGWPLNVHHPASSFCFSKQLLLPRLVRTPSQEARLQAHSPPSYSITMTPENRPKERGSDSGWSLESSPNHMKWDSASAPICPFTANNLGLTAFWTDRKLFSSSKFVHHACRQLSRWNLGTSQTGPQGTRENNPTKRHTEYKWRGCNLVGKSRVREGDSTGVLFRPLGGHTETGAKML